MRAALPIVLVSGLLSGLIAFLVAQPPAAPVAPAPAMSPVRVEAPEDESAEAESEAIVELRMQIALLEGRIAELESRGRDAGREPALVGVPDGPSMGFTGLDPEEKSAFRDQVTRVLEELEAEEAVAKRAAEMEGRAKEAAASYEEYDEVDANMGETVAKLGTELGLGVQDQRELRGLLEIQNGRNREMTQMWSSGKVDDEELGRIFMENRAAHRAEVVELVGRERLGAYQAFLRQGGLGGRFSYFTAPWENWSAAAGDR